MNIKKWGIIFIFSLLLSSAFPCLKYIDSLSGKSIYFSEREHFYDHALRITLREQIGSTIYYTLNGETPTNKSKLYSAPIEIPLPESGITTTTIRAISYRANGSISSEQIHTYFVGKNIFQRYNSLVTVVTVDPDDLFDYDNGIFVPGRLRDEWLKENPDKTLKPSRPANYNLRGIQAERPAFLEVFTPNGERVVAQHVGIRVNGGSSRADAKKSLKIFAREEYGSKKIYYEFFPESLTLTTNQPTTEYKHIILRNNTTIENAAMLELLRSTNQLDVQASSPCIGYLNGVYYQTGWLLEAFDNTYFHSNYGTKQESGSWQTVSDYSEAILEGKAEDTTCQTAHEAQAAADKAYYNSFAQKDFLDEAVFQEFCRIVDVENMLLYFAAEIYAGNTDWPYNNIKMYRWYSNTGNYTDNSHTDGRWRFLLYDLDGGFSCGHSFQLLAQVLETENTQGRFHPIFYKLMQREDMRQRFTEITQELFQTVFEPAHAIQVITTFSQTMERLHFIINRQRQFFHRLNVTAIGMIALRCISRRLDNIIFKIMFWF